ncbi:hypothetical protein [Paracidovorax anthurii]|uniref:Uncharacterized protein n=1 Tax=Paracidovorax anthurii TaxID=78229 RepID=A0A328YBI7_9BURK|nr:hypothetical protein [Paracidovorax anthurii]RAR71401.1 hypothetical protein AX018_11011 [Paracidovorax anthurii]
MTRADEAEFSMLLKEEINGLYFIDNHAWKASSPMVKDSIDNCYSAANSSVAIVSGEIITLDFYSKNLIKEVGSSGIYHGGTIGSGIVKYLHSSEASYIPGGLRNGTLMASYDSVKSPETDSFVKSIWNICKKHGRKLYPITNIAAGVVSPKPHAKFIAWPDAIAKFDQVNGLYLTNNTMAYFTSKPG